MDFGFILPPATYFRRRVKEKIRRHAIQTAAPPTFTP